MVDSEGWSPRSGDQGSPHHAPDNAKFCQAWSTVSQSNREGRHSSSTELQGLDTVFEKEFSPTTLGPVSHKSKSKSDEQTQAEVKDEVEEIERLEERVAELEKQLEREKAEERVPTVADVEGPSQAEIDRHEVTHTLRRAGARPVRKA